MTTTINYYLCGNVYIFLTKTCALSFYSSDAISLLRFLLQMVNSSNQQNGTKNETTFQVFSSSECIAWLTVVMAHSVAIVTLNILTIIVFIKNRGLRKRSMYLVINLAVADMFVGGYVGALNFFYTGPLCNFWQTKLPVFELWFSVIYGLSNTFTLTSIINLAAISLERLHATFCPFKHRLIKKWWLGVTVAVIWVTAGLLVAVCVFFFTSKDEDMYVVSFYVSPLLFWSISLFIIFISYVSIVAKISCGARPQHHGAARERKLTKTLFIVTLLSLLLVLPEIIFLHLHWFQNNDSSVNSLSSQLFIHLSNAVNFFRCTNSLINPILYTFRMPEFKRALVSLLRCRSQPAAVQDFPLGVM